MIKENQFIGKKSFKKIQFNSFGGGKMYRALKDRRGLDGKRPTITTPGQNPKHAMGREEVGRTIYSQRRRTINNMLLETKLRDVPGYASQFDGDEVPGSVLLNNPRPNNSYVLGGVYTPDGEKYFTAALMDKSTIAVYESNEVGVPGRQTATIKRDQNNDLQITGSVPTGMMGHIPELVLYKEAMSEMTPEKKIKSLVEELQHKF